VSAAPNRARFLLDSLVDLRDSLRARGGDLTVRHGSPEAEVIRLATQASAQMVFVAGDVSRYTARRQARWPANAHATGSNCGLPRA
jgi:deoxyribodipyrimidine photo-lyase